MKYGFVLTGKDKKRSEYELLCLLNYFQIEYEIEQKIENMIVVETSHSDWRKLFEQSAYIRSVELIHHITTLHEPFDCSFVKGPYFVKTINLIRSKSRKESIDLAPYIDAIWYSLDSPQVSKSGQLINLFHNYSNFVYSTPLLSRTFEESKVENPHSIKDELAKFMINVALVDNPSFLDPFCGGGKLVYFANEMGFEAKGIDNDPFAIKKAHRLYGNIPVELGDAFKINKFPKCIVTDPPYFRNTKGSENEYVEFYSKFFEYYNRDEISSIVFMAPKHFNLDFNLLSKFNLIKTFEIYIHKTLTRVLYILRNKN